MEPPAFLLTKTADVPWEPLAFGGSIRKVLYLDGCTGGYVRFQYVTPRGAPARRQLNLGVCKASCWSYSDKPRWEFDSPTDLVGYALDQR